ncbi:hypothetical protein FOMPIDRAFT_87207 [Fomitopsis schrenkii]|uniref:Fungal-type protein kinase domain-containing protein n=1 Tax=Fomitopsis schrenkii TaxID=2126942 RepID=S8FGZ7_FOMSC|nr:hypothetical protein FOMPIDRAFT_87207 [Fomitopsis schrenkii]
MSHDSSYSSDEEEPEGTHYWQTLNKYDIQRLPWTQEIKDRISVFNESVDDFLDVFVPGPGPSKWPPKKSFKDGFKNGDTKGKEVEKYPNVMGGLTNLVQDFESDIRPVFTEGSRCRVPFPFEAWDEDRHYAMPDIIMSLPGNSDAKWARTWTGISTVFEVRPDGLEDPVDEDSATIRTKALPTYGLIQIAKSARNLLHTHRLLYAYVVGIYGDKARIYRFDHAACVVSKAIDLKKDPYPLYDFLWRFCHYEHGGRPASASPQAMTPLSAETAGSTRPSTRSMTEPVRVAEQRRTAEPGMFLGMDPTITPASEADCNKVDELLQTSVPPQKRLTKDERKSCRWVTVVTEYNPDGSAKTTKRYIMYRFRFVTPRVFSRATRVSDAYEAETWERRAIKDAWRQLARDREDVLYDQLRDELRYRDDLEKLVEEYKNFGLSRDNSTTSDDDTRSDGPPPSTAASDNESEDEPDDEGTPVRADEPVGVSYDTPLYGLPNVEAADDLGAREARKLFHRKRKNSEEGPTPGAVSPSEADLNSLTLGEADRPPVYDVYHRTISTWSFRKWRNGARFYERSHMRLVMKTVGRPLSSFKSTKEMVAAIRDALIGHMLAFKAGMIHSDLSEGNVMIHDGGMFTGFLLDLDCAFNWMEVLELAGWGPVDESSWAMYVNEYNQQPGVARNRRYAWAPTTESIPALVAVPDSEMPPARVVHQRASWSQRIKRVERTGTLSFISAQLLRTYVAHDVRHDLESAVWLLLSMVLRHTVPVEPRLQRELDRYALYSEHFEGNTEREMYKTKISTIFDEVYWEVKGNKPLNKLIHHLHILVLMVYAQYRDQFIGPRMALTYENVLTAFNRALASSDWPGNDAALPFVPPRDDNPNDSEPRGTKRPKEEDDSDDDDAADAEGSSPVHKKPLLG